MTPLIHLNYDIIQLLEGYVLSAYKAKREKDIEDARAFHEENYQNMSSDGRFVLSKMYHYMISNVFNIHPSMSVDCIAQRYTSTPSPPLLFLDRISSKELKFCGAVNSCVRVYERKLEKNKDNPKLKDFGYTYRGCGRKRPGQVLPVGARPLSCPPPDHIIFTNPKLFYTRFALAKRPHHE